MLKHFDIFDKEIRFTLRGHNAMVSPGGDENDTWTKDNRIKKITEPDSGKAFRETGSFPSDYR